MTGDFSGRQPSAVLKALALLEEVARIGPGATAQDISEHLKLPKATTYRLLNLLVQHEYLVRLPDLRGFALGHKVDMLRGPTEERLSDARIDRILDDVRGSTRGGAHLIAWRDGGADVLRTDGDFPMTEIARAGLRDLADNRKLPRAVTADRPLGTFVMPIRREATGELLGGLVLIVPTRRLDDLDTIHQIASEAAASLRAAFG